MTREKMNEVGKFLRSLRLRNLPLTEVAKRISGLTKRLGVRNSIGRVRGWCQKFSYHFTDSRHLNSGRWNKLTPTKEREYRRVLEFGATHNLSLEQVGLRLSLTKERLRQLYEKFAIRRRKVKKRKTEDKIDMGWFRRKVKQGLTIQELAFLCFVSAETIRQICKRHNLPLVTLVEKRRAEQWQLFQQGWVRCSHCRRWKFKDCFYRNQKERLGLCRVCIQCMREAYVLRKQRLAQNQTPACPANGGARRGFSLLSATYIHPRPIRQVADWAGILRADNKEKSPFREERNCLQSCAET